MFDLTEKDIEEIVLKLKQKVVKSGNVNENSIIGSYPLEYVIECGLKYIYGVEHMGDSVILDCQTSFKDDLILSKPHSCKSDVFSVQFDKFMSDSTGIVSTSWSGCNLAMANENGKIGAYYKKVLLFDFVVTNPTTVAANTEYICAGTKSGSIVLYHPTQHEREIQNRHSRAVTDLIIYNNRFMSASKDGTVFTDKLIKVADCAIYFIVATNDNKIATANEDNSISIIENSEVTTYLGHKNRIKKLSYRNNIVSTSEDGALGVLRDNKLNMFDFGCSEHVQGDQIVYGFVGNKIKSFDLITTEIKEVFNGENVINCIDIRVDESILAFTTVLENKTTILHLMDLKTNRVIERSIDKDVKYIKFATSNNYMLILTTDGTILCDIRRMY